MIVNDEARVLIERMSMTSLSSLSEELNREIKNRRIEPLGGNKIGPGISEAMGQPLNAQAQALAGSKPLVAEAQGSINRATQPDECMDKPTESEAIHLDRIADNLLNISPAEFVRVVARHEVAEFKLRKRLDALEALQRDHRRLHKNHLDELYKHIDELGKALDGVTREHLQRLDNQKNALRMKAEYRHVTSLESNLRGMTDMVVQLREEVRLLTYNLQPSEREGNENLKVKALEENIRTLLVMSDNTTRSLNELNDQLNGLDGVKVKVRRLYEMAHEVKGSTRKRK